MVLILCLMALTRCPIHYVEVLISKCVKPVEPVFENVCIGLLVTHNVSIYHAMFDAYASIPCIS